MVKETSLVDRIRNKSIKRLEKEFKHGCDKSDADYYWSESFYWFTRSIDITINELAKQGKQIPHHTSNEK